MKAHIAKRWIAALRSGKYKQGREQLRTVENKFCCLGVLCDLHAQAHPEIAAKEHSPHFYLSEVHVLPREVQRWADMHSSVGEVMLNTQFTALAHLNDNGKSFKVIANVIEKHWAQL